MVVAVRCWCAGAGIELVLKYIQTLPRDNPPHRICPLILDHEQVHFAVGVEVGGHNAACVELVAHSNERGDIDKFFARHV